MTACWFVYQRFSLKVLQFNVIEQVCASLRFPFVHALSALVRFALIPDPLFCIAYRPQRKGAQEAEERRPELPQPYEDPARRYDELDELVCLVQIVLALDVEFLVAAVLPELEDGGKIYARTVEWDDPDAEDLGDVYVEDEVALVVCWSGPSASFFAPSLSKSPPNVRCM